MAAGSPGYCKVCDFQYADILNRKLADLGEKKFTSQAALRFAQELDPGFRFDRETWRKHKAHITHPLVTLQKQALADPVIVPKTNVGKLEAIADIAMQKAMNNPESVSIDHGLKAIGILENKKDRKDTFVVLLAKAFSDQLPELEDTIEGEWTALPDAQED